ncbi:methylmalonyl-CoA carboxytransferase subunit 5S [Chlorobaculum thiosulfatiphilum]|uniref:Methylmalonyl-CoA carboxytransferase subunit 5S n=1 Tax=Chlorobaculum thiosulfatiphilum TaxID=115852 RepID=A0A5C4SAI1_CHLTI|nr:methylmalonyl-CoA carboxytransferase subunit 5S [Chlorobaculum thiosulfatiphilum]TNJ40282.1 methylmalonyl-CoA carboxytransferase subunit 5S [Chlorobaculum thiosulfatiphilum]
MEPRIIDITELALRDAHQSLIATRLGIDDMTGACADLDEAGYWSIECWGGATYDACIRYLNEDPWERLRTFKKLMPKTPLQMLLRGQNLLGYRHYQDEVVERFCQKSAENGIGVFRIFDALNDLRNIETSVRAVKNVGGHAQGTISYTVSPIHTTALFVDQARRLQEMGVDSICIKDMAALIKPQAAYELVRGIKEACGADLRVHLHVHATTGVTLVSLMKAVEAGVDCVDTAVSSMSLGPGHNPTESFIEMLEGTGFATRVDMERVQRVKRHFMNVLERYSEFQSKVTGVETELFKSQIPGGMLSNMENQLRQQGAGDRMQEVLDEIPLVRRDTGYVPLVTPSSQIVGTQAVLNVLMGRYAVLTGEFADLMLGYYGKGPGEKNPEVVEMAHRHAGKQPVTCRPADLLQPEWQKLRSEALALEGCNGSDEDVLTYAMFPQIAPKFFATRHEGPRNLGCDPHTGVSETHPAEGHQGAITGPITYAVTLSGRQHKVTVAPYQ